MILYLLNCTNRDQLASTIDYSTVSSNEAILMLWSYDDILKNGEWIIVGNIDVQTNEMPNFWTFGADGKYYF
jgi:hypothetical protein